MLVLVAAAVALPAPARAQDAFPDVIALPDGWRPEGIAAGRGTSFFVGSLSDGAVYRGDVSTGEGAVLVPGQAGNVAAGMKIDARSNALFVAGGPTGRATVYDADSGAMLVSVQLVPPGSGFINDVVVTRGGAWFTNSFAPSLYRVPIGPGGDVDPSASPETIPLHGEWIQLSGFNANGIVATPDGEFLIVVNSAAGALYRVSPATGEAWRIDLGGSDLPAGDGLLLHGRNLYVVQNRLNQIAVVRLAPTLLSGQVVGMITDPDFDVPTTIATFGNSLYAVNARFATPPTPDTPYDVIAVPRRRD